MRLAIFSMCVASLAGIAWAAVPATQPISLARTPATVLILPVTPPPQGGQSWVGKSIQQDLIADLSQVADVQVLSSKSPAGNEQEALRAVRDAGARFVLYAQAQSSGGSLRVTGQMLDAETGKAIGGLKATAPMDDLFRLEDELAAQAIAALPGRAPPQVVGAPGVPPTQPSTYSSQEAPTIPYEPLATAPQYPSASVPQYYSYQEPEPYPAYERRYYYYEPYAYPYWGYYWYPWGPDVFIIGGWSFHHGHWWHDHDWDRAHSFGPHVITPHGGPSHVGPGGGAHGGGGDHAGAGGHSGGNGHR